MAGMKESSRARQRKEERRQAFCRSMTEWAQKERTSKGTEAGSGVGRAKKARGNWVQEANVSKPTTPTTTTTATPTAANKKISPITTCDLQGYAAAALPCTGDQQQVSFQANDCSLTPMEQSVFALQRRLQAQEQEQAQAASASSLPTANLYNSSSYLAQCQNMAVAAAAHLQEERQQLLMAHRRVVLEQRQCAHAMVAAAARSQAAGCLDPQQQEEKEQETAASMSPAARTNRARSALVLLMQQQQCIQDLEQQLAIASSLSLAAAAAAAADKSASPSLAPKAAVVVDLVDDEDDEGTMAASSHSSLASSLCMQKQQKQQQQQQPQQQQVQGEVKNDNKQVSPVPPLSVYALFLKDEWTKIMQHAKAKNCSVNPKILIQVIATKWKTLDQAILIRYAVLASLDNECYQRECTAQAYNLQQQQQQEQQQQHVQY